MTLDDTIYNWLQIGYVIEKRPDDRAAKETYQFFTEMLYADFELQEIDVRVEDQMYVVRFMYEEKHREKKFPVEIVHQLYHDIESEPKFG